MKVVGKQRNSKMCFICGMDNPIGLKAQFYNMEDGSVMTKFQYREEHQSFPQRVHGGLIATMLDELGLRALWAKGSEERFGVTLSMESKFRKPVPYNEILIGRQFLNNVYYNDIVKSGALLYNEKLSKEEKVYNYVKEFIENKNEIDLYYIDNYINTENFNYLYSEFDNDVTINIIKNKDEEIIHELDKELINSKKRKLNM